LADHFSSFGELSSVVLEDTEAHNHDETLKPSLSCSACVTFTTRQSAEKAFIGGKSCKEHTLRFMWLTASPGLNNHPRSQKTHPQSVPSGSLNPVGKTSFDVAANPHNKSVSAAESTKTSVGISEAPHSTSSLLSNVECPGEPGATRNSVSDSDLPQ
jgi:RNA-binding protein 26